MLTFELPDALQVDLEGKRAAWEGVVLIPFVDEVGEVDR
jgi:5'-3' exonuclease